MRTLSISATDVRIYPDAQSLACAASDAFVGSARNAISARGRFMVALAGGSTPRAIYSILGNDPQHEAGTLQWHQVHLFFGDERPVPPDHPDSNFRMANDAMLSKLPIPAPNVHRIHAELGAARAADEYQEELRAVMNAGAGGSPRLDLILLGMGPDGHTASLFPGSPGLNERTRLVCANWIEKLDGFRITLTYPALNAASEVLFIVSGDEKSEMLRKVLRHEPTATTYPAQLVRPTNGKLVWLVDEAAAARL
jgi:6-phosphogluconolactonase